MEESTNQVIWQDRKHHLWFPISFTKYVVKNNRLLIQKGFFNSQLDETLLYRIVDLTMNQSLLGKLFGTGCITVTSRVDTEAVLILENIKNPMTVYSTLSDVVENCRKNQNVVGKEFYGGRGAGECNELHGAAGMMGMDGFGNDADGGL